MLQVTKANIKKTKLQSRQYPNTLSLSVSDCKLTIEEINKYRCTYSAETYLRHYRS